MISKLKEQNTQIVIAIIAIFVVVSLTYFGFRAPYHHYLPMIHLAQNPGDFGLDPVLSNSVYLKASIYYDLLAFAKVPITNDLLGLTLHYALNGLVLYLLWNVTRTVLGVKNSVSATLLVLTSCFLYSKFVLGVTAMPIAYVTLTPTGLAHLAGMCALLLLLQRQYLAAFILATLCVGLNPKGNILIVPGLVFYLLIDSSIPRRTILWATLPIGYVLWRAIDTTSGGSTEDASRMIINIMRREEEDGLFSKQPVLMQLAFAATILSWPLLAKQITNHSLRKLGWAFYLTTSGAVLFNIIYEPLAPQYPVPVLIMLAIPLSTKYFLFLYSITLMAWILTTERFATYERIALLFAFFVFKGFIINVALAIGIGAVSVVLPRLFKASAKPDSILLRMIAHVEKLPLPVILPVLLAGFVLFRSGNTYVGPSWIDSVSFRQTGSWSTGVFADEATWQAWKQLKKHPGDFPLLAIYKLERSPYPGLQVGQFTVHTFAAVTARKSPFATLPAGAYLDFLVWQESQKRWEIRQEILERLNSNFPIDDSFIGKVSIRKEGIRLSINETLTGFLQKRHVRILAPEVLSPLFPSQFPRTKIGSHILINFSPKTGR